MSCDVPGCICDVPAWQEHRDLKVRCKFNPMQAVVKDRIVVLVDDSIVRGTTAKQLIALMKQADFSLFLSLSSLSLPPSLPLSLSLSCESELLFCLALIIAVLIDWCVG